MLGAGVLLFVVLAGLLVPLALSSRHHTFDEARSAEVTAASTLAGQVSDPVARASALVSEAPHPGQNLVSAVRSVAQTAGMRVLVVDRYLRVLADSSANRLPGRALTRPDDGLRQVLTPRRVVPRPVAHTADGELVVTVPVLEAGRVVGAVQVARPMSAVQSRTRNRDLTLVALGVGALVVGIGVAALLATRLTRPVQRLGEVARRFGNGDLDARAEQDPVRELDELSASFNTMAAALATNVKAQQEFAANASHQFKTPLTGLQLRLESIANGADVDAPAEARRAMADVARLKALTEDLLELAHASAPPTSREIVDLGALAAIVTERWTETARRHNKQLQVNVSDTAHVRADSEDLEHLLDNLIDNAVRYSDNGATIVVDVRRNVMTVSDNGPGIPVDEQAHIFERFYRGRNARSTASGTGLGLPVVVAIAARWGGNVRLIPAAGTRIAVSLPQTTNETPERSTVRSRA
jgi:signal transduction histidine kinase